MTQLDRIEQKLDDLAHTLQLLLDAVIEDDVDDDNEVTDLSGSVSRARDGTQPL